MQFLTAELDFAFNLLDAAHAALTDQHRNECIADAQKAYLAVVQFLPRIPLDAATEASIHGRLGELRNLFHRLGLPIPIAE